MGMIPYASRIQNPASTGLKVTGTQRAQYPLIKDYTLNNKGIHIMIYAIFLNYGVLGSLGGVAV